MTFCQMYLVSGRYQAPYTVPPWHWHLQLRMMGMAPRRDAVRGGFDWCHSSCNSMLPPAEKLGNFNGEGKPIQELRV